MACGRLAKDVQYLQRHIDAQTNGQAEVIDVDDNLEFLHINFMPNDGLYRGAKLKFKFVFSEMYPEDVPCVLCLDKVYHPNIDTTPESLEDESSNICVSLLDEWESSMGLDHVVLAVLFLLHNPNPGDALSPYFDGDLELEDLEENIRNALSGETVEGISWPSLLMDDANTVAEEGEVKEKEPVNVPTETSERTSINEQPSDSPGEHFSTAVNEMADSENLAIVPAQSLDSGTATGSKDADGLDLLNEASTSNCGNSKESLLDTKILNHQKLAETDVVTQTLKDSPVIYDLEAVDCDCMFSEAHRHDGSLGIRGLLSCTGCRVSRIKALFSCFHRRDATAQIQATSAGALCDLGDCEVD